MAGWSRRSFLRTSTALGVASTVAECAGEARQEDVKVKFIDTHIHVVNPRIPGVSMKSSPEL